jgi:hypothetical protein
MTTTIEETVAEPLAALPSYKAGGTLTSIAGVPAETEVRYLSIPDFPGTYDGVALVSADEGDRGYMWEVNTERVRQSRALDPYRGCYGWWVNRSMLGDDAEEPAPTEESEPTTLAPPWVARYRVKRTVNAYLSQNRTVPVIERDGPFNRVGIALAPPPVGPMGNMWVVDAEHVATVPELRHFMGWYAQWVNHDQVERYTPPANAAGADLTSVPAEHRPDIPADSRWGTTGYSGLPHGRYLFHRVPGNGGDLVAALWPGHPAFSHGGHRPGLPDTWRGWWVPEDMMEFDIEPQPEPEPEPHPLAARRRSEPEVIEATEATPTEEAAPTPEVVPIRSDELDALRARVAELEADLVTVGRMMGEEAERREWCEEYESVMGRINENLSNPMPIHRPMVTVTADFSGTVTTRFQGTVSVEVPNGAGRGQIREAMRAVLAERGLASEAEIVDSEAQWGSVVMEDVRLDNWESA